MNKSVYLAAQRLRPARPSDPKNPSGIQQASADSAASTAATGVALSVTLMTGLLNLVSGYDPRNDPPTV